jgi:hypothetical protein
MTPLAGDVFAEGDEDAACALAQRLRRHRGTGHLCELRVAPVPRDSIIGEPELELGVGVSHDSFSFLFENDSDAVPVAVLDIEDRAMGA